MRILVIADTHIPARAKTLPAPVAAALRRADLVLHAGDVTTRPVLAELERCAPVVAVAGNNDEPHLASCLPARAIVIAGRFRIGLVHGHGVGGTTFSRASSSFARGEVDCVVFGHSHQPLCLLQNGVYYLNPGSPTDRRRQPRFSFAWVTADEALAPELVFFDRPPTR